MKEIDFAFKKNYKIIPMILFWSMIKGLNKRKF